MDIEADGLSRLAVWPVEYIIGRDFHHDLAEQYNLFEPVDARYQDVFLASVQGYQIYSYLNLIDSHFGRDVREVVQVYMLKAFDRIAHARILVEYTLQIVEHAAQYPGEEDIPSETRIALMLLLSLPESPDYAKNELERRDRIKTMPMNIEIKLIACLEKGRKELDALFKKEIGSGSPKVTGYFGLT